MTRPLNAGSLARMRIVAASRSVDCVSVFTGNEYRKVARALLAETTNRRACGWMQRQRKIQAAMLVR